MIKIGKFHKADQCDFYWKPFFEQDVWEDGTLSIYWLCFWIDIHPWYSRQHKKGKP